MIWLLLCIFSSTTLFYVFKATGLKNIPALPVIIVNYLVASSVGFLVGGEKIRLDSFLQGPWFYLAVTIGILFILMFFVISLSSREAGISVTTVASKMSVVVPISFSILADPEDRLTTLKIIGIFLALVAVFLTVRNGREGQKKHFSPYPFILFAGMGFTDTLVKYAQMKFISNSELSYFTAILFLISFITGVVIILFRKADRRSLFQTQVLKWGIILGIANFGSIYFLIRALNHVPSHGNASGSSVVFGINNTGIVLLSVLAGILIFGEKLKPVNKAGIALSVLAIILFMYA